MKKIISVFIALLLIISAIGVTAFAADSSFKIELTSDKTNIEKDGTVTVTVAVKEIVDDNGLFGFNYYIDYDPTLFTVVEGEETVKLTAPECWTGKPELNYNVVKKDGAEVGQISVMFVADLMSTDLLTQGCKGEGPKAEVTFKCIKEFTEAEFKLDGEEIHATSLSAKEGGGYNFANVKGTSNVLKLTYGGTTAESQTPADVSETETEQSSSPVIYIAIGAGALVIIALVLIVVLRKKK